MCMRGHGHASTHGQLSGGGKSPREGFQGSDLTAEALHELIWSREVVAELRAEGHPTTMSTDAGTHQSMSAWDPACSSTPLGLHSRAVCVNAGGSVDEIQPGANAGQEEVSLESSTSQAILAEIPPE